MRYNIILIIKYQTEKSLSTNFRKIPESKTKVSSIKSEVPAQLLDAIFPNIVSNLIKVSPSIFYYFSHSAKKNYKIFLIAGRKFMPRKLFSKQKESLPQKPSPQTFCLLC